MQRFRPQARRALCCFSLTALLFTFAVWPQDAAAQRAGSAPAPPDISGVYESIANGRVLPGGLKNSGSPGEIALLPSALEQMKAVNPKDDPWRMCQPIGQFRMMAREHTIIELDPATGRMGMLFEDVAHGLIRFIYLNRGHSGRPTVGADPNLTFSPFSWLGDSVGRWEGDTLVVDTIAFNTETWLNDAGARHSEALHQIERIRPILGGKFLEYKMTAEDPQALAKPYTYTRYFEKLDAEIGDDICLDEE
jgi:hypothetical protein